MTGWIHRQPDLSRQPSWRTYQAQLRQHRPVHGRLPSKRWLPWTAAALVILIAAASWGLFPGGERGNTVGQGAASSPLAAGRQGAMIIDKADLPGLLENVCLTDPAAQPVTITVGGVPCAVTTSLDTGLQRHLLDRLDRVNSRFIGIVAMAPDTGRLLALVGFDQADPQVNPCLQADFPAASIFKIVTAAALVEEKGYTPGTTLTFNGGKYTLFKRQLTDVVNRYTHSISLQDSFAQSVNPVFGKVGAMDLGGGLLQAYGDAFGFNRQVNFELPWPTSRLTVTEEAYHLAEIASGFNRQTTISPLHGAVMVSAVVNGGTPVEPTLVDRITDPSGTVVYRSEPRFLPAAVSSQTAAVLNQLMTATVSSGTAKKPFRGYPSDKVLGHLTLGGKTGSISNHTREARFDWFVGFATEKNGSEKMVVSVMVAHAKFIGTRAGAYARMAIEYHFKDYFAKKAQESKPPVEGADSTPLGDKEA